MFLDEFAERLSALGVKVERINEARLDIHKRLRERHRHYHTLVHLEHLFSQLLPVFDQLRDEDSVILAIAYHDAVYDVKRSDNEERSAELARKTLKPLGLNHRLIDHCASMIIATKAHAPSEDPDTNLFTDADLSILGAPSEAYAHYAEQVRKEYAMYPAFLYDPGRRKVLAHFLAMPRIFKTVYFQDLFEAQARINLREELDRLG